MKNEKVHFALNAAGLTKQFYTKRNPEKGKALVDILPGSSTQRNTEIPKDDFSENQRILPIIPPADETSLVDSVQAVGDAAQDAVQTQNSNPIKGFIDRSKASYQEWRDLQEKIQAHVAMVSKKEWNVQEGINTYRLSLSSAQFKNPKLDQEIWDLASEIKDREVKLSKTTLHPPLYLRNLTSLRKIEEEWTDLVNTQDRLLNILTKSPKSIDFYNRMNLARIRKQEQDSREAEFKRRNDQAREAFERALSQLSQPSEKGGIAALGSTILKLEDAQNYWNQRMLEVNNLEISSQVDPEEIVTVFRNLQNIIADAPAMAERVKEVETTFIRLMSMHEELSTFGKSVIPPDELSKMLITIQDEIPRLWTTGAWDKLRRSLNEVTSFVKFYELPIRSELSLAERRKPGLTRAVLAGANNLPVGQATPLIRSMVSAIDSRDRFNRGHSDTVARLAIQMAKKMNWSNDDIDMLEIAALLHDVGKIAIPESVLNKTDPLTRDEWKTIQMHPYHGARIVKSLDTLNRIIPWVYHHQERWDGDGYPDKLSGASIPSAARLIGLSEAYTVMISDQPKRKALNVEQAFDEIKKSAGSQFDPEAVEAFSDCITIEPPSGSNEE